MIIKDADRIYQEVLKGVTESDTDTDEQRAYRTRISRQLAEILAKGGTPEPWNE